MESLRDTFSNYKDYELEKVIKNSEGLYTASAVELAKDILASRGVNLESKREKAPFQKTFFISVIGFLIWIYVILKNYMVSQSESFIEIYVEAIRLSLLVHLNILIFVMVGFSILFSIPISKKNWNSNASWSVLILVFCMGTYLAFFLLYLG